MKRKLKKSNWLPWILAVYAAAMSIYFGPELIASGNHTRFWITLVAEALCITGVYFALRRKERLQAEREEKEKG